MQMVCFLLLEKKMIREIFVHWVEVDFISVGHLFIL